MIVLDLETTGVNPQKHSIISIGALDFDNPKDEIYIECLPWEGAEIMDEALEVNGFTRERIFSSNKTLELAMIEFDKWSEIISDHTLAGQNVGVFDWQFLRNSFEIYRMNWSYPHRTIDTHSLTYMHLVKRGVRPPVENNRTAINSSFIQNYVGISEEPKPHNALNGAKVAGEAISRLLYGKGLLPEFAEHPIPEYLL